jgi:hypothetical protein
LPKIAVEMTDDAHGRCRVWNDEDDEDDVISLAGLSDGAGRLTSMKQGRLTGDADLLAVSSLKSGDNTLEPEVAKPNAVLLLTLKELYDCSAASLGGSLMADGGHGTNWSVSVAAVESVCLSCCDSNSINCPRKLKLGDIDGRLSLTYLRK